MTNPSALMADSVEPASIPNRFARRPNGVLIYNDGPHKWPEDQVRRFKSCWRITVEGDPAHAVNAREMDVETYDITPDAIPAYRDARWAHQMGTIVYCNRSTIPAVWDAVGSWAHLHLHVATLDGVNWNPQSLSQNIWQNYHVDVPPYLIIAIQNMPMGSFDQSSIFGRPGWEPIPG